jgi:hypothetical protein
VVGIATSRRINVERASRLCLLLDWTCYRRKTSRADDNFTDLEVRKKQILRKFCTQIAKVQASK